MTHQEIKDNFNRHTQFEAEFIAQTFVLSVLKPDGDLVGAISEMITEGIPADKEEIETYERFLDWYKSHYIDIQTTSVDPYEELSERTYKLPDGRKVIIGTHEIDFFRKLRKLPAPTKIFMMNLTEDEMLQYVEDQHKKSLAHLLSLLTKKWYYRETGDEAELDERIMEEFIGVKMNIKQLIKQVKSKKGLDRTIAIKLIHFFEGPKSDLYNKD